MNETIKKAFDEIDNFDRYELNNLKRSFTGTGELTLQYVVSRLKEYVDDEYKCQYVRDFYKKWIIDWEHCQCDLSMLLIPYEDNEFPF